MGLPKNGHYVTEVDFEQFQDYYDRIAPEWGGKEGLKIKTVTFVVTEICNLACTYCYETHKTTKRMSRETAKAAVDLLFDKEKENGYLGESVQGIVLDFIGGEPLLEIDLMDFITDYFKFRALQEGSPWAFNYMICISSNGVLYRNPKVQKYLEKNKGRVSMNISIDGNESLHDSARVFHDGRGSYKIVEKAVKENVSRGNRSVKMTVAPENIEHLVPAVQNLWQLGVTGGYMNYTYERGWKIDHANFSYNKLKEIGQIMIHDERYKEYFVGFFNETLGVKSTSNSNYCGGNGDMLAFSVDGAATPCLRFLKYTLNNQEEQTIGDIYNGIESADENRWLNKLKKITRVSQAPPKCHECPISQNCGGCTAYNYDVTGDPNRKATYSCKMHRSRVLANYHYWNNLYRHLDMEKRKPIMMPIAWALEIITEEDYHELQALSLPNDNVEVVDTQLILEVDTTYHRNGKRELLTFELDQLEEAKKQYHLHHKGFVALYKAEFDENYSVIKSTLIQDEEGKRYVKGSPFYKFPTVKRLAKQEWINLKEQEIALQKERKSNGKRRSK